MCAISSMYIIKRSMSCELHSTSSCRSHDNAALADHEVDGKLCRDVRKRFRLLAGLTE